MIDTKYRTLVTTLKADILSGRYGRENPFPSVRALIKRYGLSNTTVLHAMDELRHQGLISRKQGCGTFVTKCGLNHKIGLIVPGVAYCEIYPPIVSEISRLAQERGYKLLIGDVPCRMSNDGTRLTTKVAEDFVRDQVGGVIFQPLESVAGAGEYNRKVLSLFVAARIPVVLVGYDVVCPPDRSEYDVVGINNFNAGSVIARHLLDVGAKRIHYFQQRGRRLPSGENRIRGIVAFLGAKRFSPVKNVFETFPDDVAGVRRYLRKNRPDAIVCENDSMAAAVRQTLARIGVSVPKDVLLAGFDDVNIARLTQLTTVRQPCESIARAAFRRLLDRMDDPAGEPMEIFLSAQLVQRDSTRRPMCIRQNPKIKNKGVRK